MELAASWTFTHTVALYYRCPRKRNPLSDTDTNISQSKVLRYSLIRKYQEARYLIYARTGQGEGGIQLVTTFNHR